MKSIKLALSAMLFLFGTSVAWADVYLGSGPSQVVADPLVGAYAAPGSPAALWLQTSAASQGRPTFMTNAPQLQQTQIPPPPIQYGRGGQFIQNGGQQFVQQPGFSGGIDPRCPRGGVPVARNPDGGYRCAVQNGGGQQFGQQIVQNGAYGMVQQRYAQPRYVNNGSDQGGLEIPDFCQDGDGRVIACGLAGAFAGWAGTRAYERISGDDVDSTGIAIATGLLGMMTAAFSDDGDLR